MMFRIKHTLCLLFISLLTGQASAQMDEISVINFDKGIDYYKTNQFVDAESAFAKSISSVKLLVDPMGKFKDGPVEVTLTIC